MIIVVTRIFLIADLFHTLQFQTSNMKLSWSILSIVCLSLCFLARVEAKERSHWHIQGSDGFSSSEANRFKRIAINAITRAGDGSLENWVYRRHKINRYDVANEIRAECEKIWPTEDNDWIVLYVSGSWAVSAYFHKFINVQQQFRDGPDWEYDYVYALRV